MLYRRLLLCSALVVTVIIFGASILVSYSGSTVAKAATGGVEQEPLVLMGIPDRESTKKQKESKVKVTNLEDQGTLDLGELGIKPSARPLPHVTRSPKSSTVGKGKASFGASQEIVNQSTTNAFGTLATNWIPGESVDFYLNGALSSTFVANATNGYVAVGINTGAGFGFITIDEIGQTSGREAGGVVQVAPTGPYVPGVVAGPHAVNSTASPLLLMYGWGNPATTSMNLYRNGTLLTTTTTSAAGRYFVSVAVANNGDTAAVYGSDRTGVAGSFAGSTVEERSDAGTSPLGDQNAARAFVDRPTINSATGGTAAIVGENFAAGETVAVSNCATASMAADTNGSVGIFLTVAPGAAIYTCVFTGATSGRVARAALQAQANVTTVRGLIVQPSLANPGGTVKVLATRLPASDAGQFFLDGVLQGTTSANAQGYGSVTLTKPASGFLHGVGWITAGGTGDSQIAVLQISPNVTTAANVTVGGRVVTSEGRGLRNAIVMIKDQSGNTRSVITGPYGTYQFADVEAGQSYVISVASKRFNFSPQVLQVTDNIADLTFIAGQ